MERMTENAPKKKPFWHKGKYLTISKEDVVNWSPIEGVRLLTYGQGAATEWEAELEPYLKRKFNVFAQFFSLGSHPLGPKEYTRKEFENLNEEWGNQYAYDCLKERRLDIKKFETEFSAAKIEMFGVIESTLDGDLGGMLQMDTIHDSKVTTCDPLALLKIIRKLCSIGGPSESTADKQVDTQLFLKSLGHSECQFTLMP